jgi:hypothetical protein
MRRPLLSELYGRAWADDATVDEVFRYIMELEFAGNRMATALSRACSFVEYQADHFSDTLLETAKDWRKILKSRRAKPTTRSLPSKAGIP